MRSRQVLGPVEASGPACALVIELRRYRCRACEATCTVGPAELFAYRRYSGAAILLALGLWGLGRLAAAAVRRRVSPVRHIGATAAAGWAALRRWTRTSWPTGPRAAATCRKSAAELVGGLLVYSPLDAATHPAWARAHAAAAHLP